MLIILHDCFFSSLVTEWWEKKLMEGKLIMMRLDTLVIYNHNHFWLCVDPDGKVWGSILSIYLHICNLIQRGCFWIELYKQLLTILGISTSTELWHSCSKEWLRSKYCSADTLPLSWHVLFNPLHGCTLHFCGHSSGKLELVCMLLCNIGSFTRC